MENISMVRSRSAGSLDLFQLIAGVHRRLEKKIDIEFKAAGLQIEPYRILDALHVRDGCTMSDLAARVFVDAPTLTKIVDRMVAHALVYRAPDPGDRRKVLIFLSEGGREKYSELRPLADNFNAALVEHLEVGNAQQLKSILENFLTDGHPRWENFPMKKSGRDEILTAREDD